MSEEMQTQQVNILEFATESLQSIGLAEYANTLVDAWAQIGEDQEDQVTYIKELSQNIKSLLDQSIEATASRRNEIEGGVCRKLDNIAVLKQELSAAIDINATEYSAPSEDTMLIQRLTALQGIEEALISERAQWVSKIETKRDQAAGMCQLLGIEFEEKLHEIGTLSPARLETFDKYIEFLTQTQSERKQIITDTKESILHFWKILEWTPTTHLEKSIAEEYCDLGVHVQVIEALQQMKADLMLEYQNRETETAELGAEIQHLWNLLQIEDKFQKYFSEKNGGIGLKAVEACRDERQRLLIKKEKLMPRIIDHEREKITQLFAQTSCDIDSQKSQFAAFHEQEKHGNTEEYLNTLKEYVVCLERRFEGLKPILSRVERRKELVAERKEYEALISNPNRLTSRGRGLSQLKENEMRNRVEKKLPKLEAHLEEMIGKWEAENEAVLTIDGAPFLTTMAEDQKQYAELQEKRRQTRTMALKNKNKDNVPSWKKSKRLNKTGRTGRKRVGGAENKAATIH